MSAPVLVFSHRGYHVEAPENTLESFERAAAMGVDGIETDVRLDADGVAILFHDRVGPGGRPVATLPRAELSRRSGRAVPTLDEALDAFDVTWMLEVKAPEAAAAVVRAVLRVGARRRVLVTSFDHVLARDLAAASGVEGGVIVAHRPLPTEALPLGLPARAGALASVVWRYDTLEPSDLERLARAGYRSWVYDLETADEHDRCRRWPLAGVVTDRPEHMLEP